MAILTINSGSSSLKFGLYTDDAADLLLTGTAQKIDEPGGSLMIKDVSGKQLYTSAKACKDQHEALDAIANQIASLSDQHVTAIGHRVVHGGPHLVTHQPITPQLLQTLQRSVHFAPLHIPPAIELIQATQQRFPGVAQFACFDTAFHQTLPPEAFTYALPLAYREAGVRRYGFHGLSYESAVHALRPGIPSRMVIAHLGSGCSICALRNGVSVDTSMGLSPAGGVVMGTRPGDLDPGVVLLLSRNLSPKLQALTPDRIESMLNHQAGLEALAGDSEMQVITQRKQAGDSEAKLAFEIFCRETAKTIAGYAAILGGLDTLIFTGGIGEHSQPARQGIVQHLSFMKIVLSEESPSKLPAIMSSPKSAVEVKVLAADEDGQIARHVAAMMSRRP